MPPRRGESIERTAEREEFIKKLEEYHEKRGYV
jgi:chromatin structure-remodeling complex subunit RSC9